MKGEGPLGARAGAEGNCRGFRGSGQGRSAWVETPGVWVRARMRVGLGGGFTFFRAGLGARVRGGDVGRRGRWVNVLQERVGVGRVSRDVGKDRDGVGSNC